MLEHDLGVATQIGEVHTRLDSELSELEVEVVRDRTHRGVALPHQREHRFLVAHVERREDQALTGVRRQKLWQVACVQIGQPDFSHFGILEQIIRTRRALQARAEY